MTMSAHDLLRLTRRLRRALEVFGARVDYTIYTVETAVAALSDLEDYLEAVVRGEEMEDEDGTGYEDER